MPRKTLKERKEQYPTEDKANRIRSVIDNVDGTEDPDDLMLLLLNVLKEKSKMPRVGGYYTFIYIPKTPNITYDQNPLVAVTEVYSWGFKGINFHWGESRQYTWDEIVGGIYEIYKEEIPDAQEIPFGKIKINS